jgi:tyrosyl-tRNA synthetase
VPVRVPIAAAAAPRSRSRRLKRADVRPLTTPYVTSETGCQAPGARQERRYNAPVSNRTEEQLEYLTKGCVDVVRSGELRMKLERSAATGSPLVVKVGFDPTAPDLHLGHTVLIRKMKHFQDLGHTVVYVVGAFTALIGDPTGRSKTRPPLTLEEIARNAETYQTQIFKILDPGKTVTRFNSEWLEPLGSVGWIRLAAQYNVAQMLERRDFESATTRGSRSRSTSSSTRSRRPTTRCT